MSVTSQRRDEIYWQQRCIAAEAREQSLTFEVAQIKQNLKHYKEQTSYWRQRYILAEAKAHTVQDGRGVKRKNCDAGGREPKNQK